MTSPWMDAKETVAYLRLGSLNALYRLIDEWQLPYGRIGRLYRFRKDHLDAWIERRGVEGEKATRVAAGTTARVFTTR